MNEPHPVLDATKPQANGQVEVATYTTKPIDWDVKGSRGAGVGDFEKGPTGIKTNLAAPE